MGPARPRGLWCLNGPAELSREGLKCCAFLPCDKCPRHVGHPKKGTTLNEGAALEAVSEKADS